MNSIVYVWKVINKDDIISFDKTKQTAYYKGKIIGGIYDDRFLVKPTKTAKQMMPNASFEVPYDGAKEMLLVDDVDNRDFLCDLLESVVDELPAPKQKKPPKKK